MIWPLLALSGLATRLSQRPLSGQGELGRSSKGVA
jgi:hypothetical protein